MHLQIQEEPTSAVQSTEFLNGRSKAVCFQSALFNKTVICHDYIGFMVQEGESAAMVE